MVQVLIVTVADLNQEHFSRKDFQKIFLESSFFQRPPHFPPFIKALIMKLIVSPGQMESLKIVENLSTFHPFPIIFLFVFLQALAATKRLKQAVLFSVHSSAHKAAVFSYFVIKHCEKR